MTTQTSMSKQSHTLTPWEWRAAPTGQFAVHDHYGMVACVTGGQSLTDGDRAKHIVHCVNTHDALIAALRAIVKITDGSQPKDYPGALMVAQSALKAIDHD